MGRNFHLGNKLKYIATIAAFGSIVSPQIASATNGQLPTCVGTYKCGMGGAGLAIASDASAAATNPALAARMGDEFVISAGWFHADVKGDAMGFHGNDGVRSSDASDFPNMSLAVNKRFRDNLGFNLAIYPGGGGATDWETARTTSGQNQGADKHIDWKMLNAQLSLAWAPTPSTALALGLVGARSTMKTDSLDNKFNQPRNGPTGSVDAAYGLGFQVGGVWDVTEQVSLAAKYHSKVWHQRFRNYLNIFNSPVDRPAIASIGINVKPTPKTNFAFDVKHVENSSVQTISSSSEADGGFHWDNVIVYMVGLEHQVTENLTLRTGWNYGNSPVGEDSMFANFLFPAIVEHHFTLGASYNMSEAIELGFSGYITPEAKVTDDGSGDGFSANNSGTWVTHRQYGSQVSLKYRF